MRTAWVVVPFEGGAMPAAELHEVGQVSEIVHRPEPIRKPCFDCRRRLDRRVLPAEVVVHEVERGGAL